jgi:tripartite-type tricarboxylate transporter receptor subunit TctC
MIVPNTSPVRSVADFISYAKANRGKISYGSAGHGTSPHLCGELFKRMTGIEMTHVPYRTGA